MTPAPSVAVAPPAAPPAPAAAPAPALGRDRAGYLPALDGLRAVAVIAVIAYHLGRLPGGFLGVDVFFVISGFLITRLLLDERRRTGGIGLRSFWARRARRLLPALFVVLAAVAVGARLWLPAWRLGEIRADAMAALAYVANWRFVASGQSYFAAGIVPSPLRHTWSLAIEEQFYVLWPLLVLAVAAAAGRRARRAVGVLAAVGAVASATWMAVLATGGADLSRVYYGTDTRAFALLAGAALAAAWPQRHRVAVVAPAVVRRTGAAVAAAALAALLVAGVDDAAWFYRGGFQLAAVASAVVVASLAAGGPVLARALSTRPLVWLGRRSYGLYLWSWPVQVVLAERAGLRGPSLDVAVVGLSVALAAASFRWIEEPVRTGRWPTVPWAAARYQPRHAAPEPAPRRTLPAPVLPAVSLVAVVAVIVGTAAGAPPAPTYTTVRDDEARALAIGPGSKADQARLEAALAASKPVDEGPPGPFTGAPAPLVDPSASVDPSAALGRSLEVMIAGDSVGFSLGFRVGPNLTPAVHLTSHALLGCGLLPSRAAFVVQGVGSEGYPPWCDDAELAEANGLAGHPDVVLLVAGTWELYDQQLDGQTYRVGTARYARLLEARIQERLDRYRALGVPTVLMLVPCYGPNVARLGDERHQQDRIDWVNDRMRAVAARNRGWARLVDPTSVVCEPDGSFRSTTPTGLPLRQDGAHYDSASAAWLWDSWLAGQLGAAFDLPDAAQTRVAGVTVTSLLPAGN